VKPVQIKNKQVRLVAVCDRVTTLKNNNGRSRHASRAVVLIDFIYAHSSDKVRKCLLV
jgi:uncharacterized protein Veg